MNKPILAVTALALAASFSSCSKGGSDPSSGSSTRKTSYKVNGLTDVSVQNNPDSNTSVTTLTITDTLKSAQKVSLSLEGLPNGCGGNLSITSGYPTYTTVLTIVDTNATPGVYPIKLNCNGDVSGKTTYTINMTVRPDHDFANDFVGMVSASYRIFSGTNYNTYSENTTHGDRANRIVFHNFLDEGAQIYADLDPAGQYLTIPAQTINGITYENTGSFLLYKDPQTKKYHTSGRIERTENGQPVAYDMNFYMY